MVDEVWGMRHDYYQSLVNLIFYDDHYVAIKFITRHF